ncbi:transcriptional regulator [Pengzhenrongella sp.]|uniref:helix-turn-helix transcriptional regulator n=1 Tax=Pengzhenrongella sp. TaxID=2888820 RepID=UPI002F93490A
MEDFASQVTGVASLAEPVRRELYLYVLAQEGAVSRDQAAAGIGVERHIAKFHLDRLVRDGLLDAESRRLGDRQGPGAGRPTKLYRRSAREVSVALPERRYDLAGELLARAIDDSVRDGTPVLAALGRAASDAGALLAASATDPSVAASTTADDDPAPPTALDRACRALASRGYEPHLRDGTITMANCPFHALARDHTELVCGMNLSLIGALTEGLGDRLEARLDPAPDRCCVVISQR